MIDRVTLTSNAPVPTICILSRRTNVGTFTTNCATSGTIVKIAQNYLSRLAHSRLRKIVNRRFDRVLGNSVNLGLQLVTVVRNLLLVCVAKQMILQLNCSSKHDHDSSGDGDNDVVFVTTLSVIVLNCLKILNKQLVGDTISHRQRFLTSTSTIRFAHGPRNVTSTLHGVNRISTKSAIASPVTRATDRLFFNRTADNLIN